MGIEREGRRRSERVRERGGGLIGCGASARRKRPSDRKKVSTRGNGEVVRALSQQGWWVSKTAEESTRW